MENVKVEYYTAAWCGPCRSVRPIVEQLQAEGWNIEKIDIDSLPDKGRSKSIQGVPTFMVYRNGELVRRFSGARGKVALEQEFKLAAQ